MTWKTKNNSPMPQEAAYQRIKDYGYEPLEPYVNNRCRMNCQDSDGYIIKLSLDSLGRCKTYQRFSVSCNEENYIFNLNRWGEQQGYHSVVLDYCPSHIHNHVLLTCCCECGQHFTVDANSWRRGDKTRCNECNAHLSNLEQTIKDYLIELNIEFQQQKRFADCRYKKPLPFDFYLPLYNCCIEVDGEQHFYPNSKYFHNRPKDAFEVLRRKDNIKTTYCNKNDIVLIRLPFYVIRETEEYKNIINTKLNIH